MKKIKLLIVIIIFILSFITHFIYTYFPNFITSIFFPVNESIWEHMKIIFTSTLISTFIEYIIYKKKGINTNNLLISIPTISILGIFFYLIIYSFINTFISHNFIITIFLLLFTYIMMEILSYKILNMKEIKYQKTIGIILIILSYILFIYLTYYPPKTSLFIDTQTNTYGIKKTP